MIDAVRRFLFEDLDIRGSHVTLGAAWQQMTRGRRWPAPVRALLGEVVVVSALIAANLKRAGRITIQLQGNGPISLLWADCDEQLRMRGMVRFDADKVGAGETAPLTALLGNGQFVVTLQSEHAAPYQSIVPLAGETLADVFAHFLSQSEQQPAWLKLSANDDHIAGLFLQKLPGADQRDEDGWRRISLLAATIRAAELAEASAPLLMRIFPEENIRLFDPRPLSYHCPRDEEKVRALLRSLGESEVRAMLDAQGEIVIEDEICQQRYRFGKEILTELFPAPRGD